MGQKVYSFEFVTTMATTYAAYHIDSNNKTRLFIDVCHAPSIGSKIKTNLFNYFCEDCVEKGLGTAGDGK